MAMTNFNRTKSTNKVTSKTVTLIHPKTYEASAWYGIAAPRNTSSEIVAKLNNEMNAGLADAGVRARLADLGGTVIPGSPADFGKLVADQIEKWGKVVKFSGVRAE